MNTYQIEIIQPLAKQLLDDLAALDLIKVRSTDDTLENVVGENGKFITDRQAIRDMAGAWSEMPESDFQEFLSEAKRSGDSIFERDIDL